MRPKGVDSTKCVFCAEVYVWVSKAVICAIVIKEYYTAVGRREFVL